MGSDAMDTEHRDSDEFSGLHELMRHEHDPAARRGSADLERRRTRRRRGLIITAIVLAVVVVLAVGYAAWALNAPLARPSATSQKPQVPAVAAATVDLSAEGSAAISVSGGDEYFGEDASGVWLTSGADDPRPIASISKLITALVVLDAHPLADAKDPGPIIVFDKADHDLYDKYYVLGATIAAMPTGSSMSQRDALATMLIPSASNYAEAVATWAFGSPAAFASAARNWLHEHKLDGTTIVEPTGISPLNTSTPRDLIRIGKLAAANPAIAKIVATPSFGLPGPGGMHNTNALLGADGITGMKTGNLGPGSYNMLYSASLDVGAEAPLSVIGIVLGGSSRETVNAGILTTLDGIRAGFHDVPVGERGQQVGTFRTPWGSKARMVLADDASIFTWSDTPITATMQTTAPVAYEDGEIVGTLTWTAGPHSVSADIEVDGDIEPPTAWWRLTHPAELGG